MVDSTSHANQLSAAESESGDIITEPRSVTGHSDIQPQEPAGEIDLGTHKVRWGGQEYADARIYLVVLPAILAREPASSP